MLIAVTVILVLVIISISTAGRYNLNKWHQKVAAKLHHLSSGRDTIISAGAIETLPGPVIRWLMRAGAEGREMPKWARLKQRGRMRIRPGGNWMKFTALQYTEGERPGYNWYVKVNRNPFFFLTGLDKLENGKGSVQMKLLGLLKIANIADSKEVNSGSLLRWLAEICWIPHLALHRQIAWKQTAADAAEATLRVKNVSVSGIFQFNPQGDVSTFTAQRYKIDGKKTSLETWQINMLDYHSFSGIRIPHRCSITWKMAAGDFTWLELEVTDIGYNTAELYR